MRFCLTLFIYHQAPIIPFVIISALSCILLEQLHRKLNPIRPPNNRKINGKKKGSC